MTDRIHGPAIRTIKPGVQLGLMPCLYCGKSVPVLRKLRDPEFCCDEHRERYRELAKVAVDRLRSSRPRRAGGHSARAASLGQRPAPQAAAPLAPAVLPNPKQYLPASSPPHTVAVRQAMDWGFAWIWLPAEVAQAGIRAAREPPPAPAMPAVNQTHAAGSLPGSGLSPAVGPPCLFASTAKLSLRRPALSEQLRALLVQGAPLGSVPAPIDVLGKAKVPPAEILPWIPATVLTEPRRCLLFAACAPSAPPPRGAPVRLLPAPPAKAGRKPPARADGDRWRLSSAPMQLPSRSQAAPCKPSIPPRLCTFLRAAAAAPLATSRCVKPQKPIGERQIFALSRLAVPLRISRIFGEASMLSAPVAADLPGWPTGHWLHRYAASWKGGAPAPVLPEAAPPVRPSLPRPRAASAAARMAGPKLAPAVLAGPRPDAETRAQGSFGLRAAELLPADAGRPRDPAGKPAVMPAEPPQVPLAGLRLPCFAAPAMRVPGLAGPTPASCVARLPAARSWTSLQPVLTQPPIREPATQAPQKTGALRSCPAIPLSTEPSRGLCRASPPAPPDSQVSLATPQSPEGAARTDWPRLVGTVTPGVSCRPTDGMRSPWWAPAANALEVRPVTKASDLVLRPAAALPDPLGAIPGHPGPCTGATGRAVLEPAGVPAVTGSPCTPSGQVQLVTVQFELPPPEPIRLRVLKAWTALPGLLRLAIAMLMLLAAPGYLLWRWAGDSFSEAVRSRSAIRVSEDFRGGLEAWTGLPGWQKTWSRGPAGYVEVGHLALLAPTLLLTDYQCEFLCAITGRSIGWVYRAKDLENYYAAELAIVKPGPLPAVSLIRYTVTGGRSMQRAEVPIREAIQKDRPVRVRLRVEGNGFTTWIGDKIVDFWQDDRFSAGGVGFFGPTRDQPQLYWVRVSHQDDTLGKLCRFLAPGRPEDFKR